MSVRQWDGASQVVASPAGYLGYPAIGIAPSCSVRVQWWDRRGAARCLEPYILGRASSGDKHPSEADQSYAAYYEHNAIEHGRAEPPSGRCAERDKAVPCEVGQDMSDIEAEQADDSKPQ
jgi:hypothetical protein